ncbi:MAG: MBL fold metallo-hydrolase [Candidatus Bathyarchaeia archaeon]
MLRRAVLKGLKVRFLGGTETVGKSAVTVKTGEATVLLDYGVGINHVPSFPMHISPREVDAVVLTHAHLDHCGAAPILYMRGRIPVYACPPTLDLTELLIKDFLRLSGYYLPYEFLDLRTMQGSARPVKYGDEVTVKDARLRFMNSGHIPGGLQVIVDDGRSRLAYASDLNDVDTMLLRGADRDYGELDAMVIEATYATEEHPERKSLEAEFIRKLDEVVEAGGTVLVPAFSVGRSQEILCVLANNHFEHPVNVDGMAVEANQIFTRHPDFLRDPELFKRALGAAEWVSGWKERKKIVKQPGVIVAPAGMLRGGLAVFYAERLARGKQNAIFLVSYQLPGTPGRELLDARKFIIFGKSRRVDAQVERFDFSSHAGMSGLHSILKGLSGSPKVYVIHGERKNCLALAQWANENGLKAVVPKVGESFDI